MNRRSDTLAKVMLYGGLAAIAAMVVLVVFSIRSGQTQTAPKVDYTQEAAKRILSCTDTDGECAVENRKKTAQYLKQLIDANALNAAKAASASASCASSGITEYKALLECTLKNMKDK